MPRGLLLHSLAGPEPELVRTYIYIYGGEVVGSGGDGEVHGQHILLTMDNPSICIKLTYICTDVCILVKINSSVI